MISPIKKFLFILFISALSKTSFGQILYSLNIELGQTFAGIENSAAIQNDFFQSAMITYQNLVVRSDFSPSVTIVNNFTFNKKQTFGGTVKVQVGRVNFSRYATYTTTQSFPSESEAGHIYKLNRFELPLEVFWRISKVKFSAGIVNTWSIGGKISRSFETVNRPLSSYQFKIGEEVTDSNAYQPFRTDYKKKFNLQSIFGIDFQLNNRWSAGVDLKYFLTKNTVSYEYGPDYMWTGRDLHNQTNSITVSISRLLVERW